MLIAVPFVLYFSPWYAAGLENPAVRELSYLALLAPGFVFFWMFLRVDPVPREYPYLVALWVCAAEVVGDAILGLAVLADQSLIAGAYYHALARPWGPSLHSDQVIGGGALWVLGDIVGLPFLAAQLVLMIREDETQAVQIDAELDAVAPPRPPRLAARRPVNPRPARPPRPPVTSPGGRRTRGSRTGSAPPTTPDEARASRGAGQPLLADQ